MTNSEEEFNKYLQELDSSQQSWFVKHWRWLSLLLIPSLYIISLLGNLSESSSTINNKIEIQLSIRKVYLPVTRNFTSCSVFFHRTRVIKKAEIKIGTVDNYILRILKKEYSSLLPYLIQEKKLDVFPILHTKRDEYEIIF